MVRSVTEGETNKLINLIKITFWRQIELHNLMAQDWTSNLENVYFISKSLNAQQDTFDAPCPSLLHCLDSITKWVSKKQSGFKKEVFN